MKKNNLKLIIPFCAGLLVLIYACGKDFLNKPPQGVLSPAIVATQAGVQGILVGAYAGLDGAGLDNSGWGSAADNWVYGSVAADDAYKGSTTTDQNDIILIMQWAALSTNSYLSNKWDAEYDAIQRCNAVIRTMRVASPALSAADTTEFRAEAVFLRAFYHFELRKIFHYPPFVDETVTAASAPPSNIDASGNYVEIWPNIEADFTYAMNNLPATQTNKGQANKWAAQAFLAKVYMFEGKYAQAQPLLDALIAGGNTAIGTAYALQPNYQENFNPDPSAKNSSESVFAAQMSVNDGSGPAGGKSYGDNLNFPYGAGPGACCGFDDPQQDLADAYKTDANGLPLLDGTWQSATPHVSDPVNAPWTGNVDPRIDWVMGRKGVPYLDWGPMPGDSWMRSPSDDGHFPPKKNVYAKAQQGVYSDVSSNWANVELDANNVNLIRYADILLWDAECNVLGASQNLTQAETYVNMIRTRAGNPTGEVYLDGAFDAPSYTYKGGTMPASTYLVKPYPAGYFSQDNGVTAMKAIIMERRLELAEEGHRFFDLGRWQAGNSIYPPAGYMTTTLMAMQAVEAGLHPAQYAGVSFTAGKSEYNPLPQDQIDQENSGGKVVLKQIPGY
jgi:hypothetical protein